RLEAVDVEHEDREMAAVAPVAGDLVVEALAQLAAVAQPGQRVDVGEVQEAGVAGLDASADGGGHEGERHGEHDGGGAEAGAGEDGERGEQTAAEGREQHGFWRSPGAIGETGGNGRHNAAPFDGAKRTPPSSQAGGPALNT